MSFFLYAILGALAGVILVASLTFVLGAIVWMIGRIFGREWRYIDVMAVIYGLPG